MPLARSNVRTARKPSFKEPAIDKFLGSAPLIPPNIFMEKLSSNNTPPPLIPQPIDPPILQPPGPLLMNLSRIL